MEGSLTVSGSAIDIELKNRTLEEAERGIEAAISTADEWGDGRFRRPGFWYDLDKSLFALRGSFEISQGRPDYAAAEVKTALEAAGYKITRSFHYLEPFASPNQTDDLSRRAEQAVPRTVTSKAHPILHLRRARQ